MACGGPEAPGRSPFSLRMGLLRDLPSPQSSPTQTGTPVAPQRPGCCLLAPWRAVSPAELWLAFLPEATAPPGEGLLASGWFPITSIPWDLYFLGSSPKFLSVDAAIFPLSSFTINPSIFLFMSFLVDFWEEGK